MVEIERQVTYETDDEYLARTFDEGYKELFKVHAAVNCSSFASGSRRGCGYCKYFAADNVRANKETGEKCLIRLALNHIAAVRNIAKTGKS